jgi:DNA-binding NarL/FixJ family response regulator
MKNKSFALAVVDDHILMREMTSFRLSMLGYNVIMEAENGKKFLDQLNDSVTPDICLLDINMPVMNGFETISYLKKNWPQIKVVFLSMHNETAYMKKAMELGADGFVTKDAPMEELSQALGQLINNFAAAA